MVDCNNAEVRHDSFWDSIMNGYGIAVPARGVSDARRLRRIALAVRLLFLGFMLAVFVGAGTGVRFGSGEERYVISGAAGRLGELTIKEMLARGVPARNLILVSRTPEKLDAYAELGAITRFGDIDRPESLASAYSGGTRMLLISVGLLGPAGMSRPRRHKVAFDAAVKAGVKRIVYTSFVGVDRDRSALAEDHGQSEALLRGSGVRWVALRNGLYSELQLPVAEQMARTGEASMYRGEGKSAWVLRDDCAAAAAGALLGDASIEDRAYDITGPDLMDTRDVARIVQEITGRRIDVELVDADSEASGPLGRLTTPAIASDGVEKLTGRLPVSVRAYLFSHKAEIVAAGSTQTR
jgi:NAD(P)H dehydrogenase (quinone)